MSHATAVLSDTSLSLDTSVHPIERHCGVGDQIIIEHNGQRYFTRFRGAKAEFSTKEAYVSGRERQAIIQDSSYLLVDFTKKLAGTTIGINTRLIIRFISEGTMFSFNTMVQGNHSRPPLLALDYPEKLERRNLRDSERFSTLLPMTFATDGAKLQHSGAVTDISAFGARLGVQSLEGITERGKLLVSFTLPSGARVAAAPMIVQNITSDGDKPYLGARFVTPESAVTDFYDECMKNLR
jgi:hypothetical protein